MSCIPDERNSPEHPYHAHGDEREEEQHVRNSSSAVALIACRGGSLVYRHLRVPVISFLAVNYVAGIDKPLINSSRREPAHWNCTGLNGGLGSAVSLASARVGSSRLKVLAVTQKCVQSCIRSGQLKWSKMIGWDLQRIRLGMSERLSKFG